MRKVMFLSLLLAACNACGSDENVANVLISEEEHSNDASVVEVDAGIEQSDAGDIAEQYDPCGFNSLWEVVYVEVSNECGSPFVGERNIFFPVVADDVLKLCGENTLEHSLIQEVSTHTCTVRRMEHCVYPDSVVHDTYHEFTLENGNLVGKRKDTWNDIADPCSATFTLIATPHK